MTETKIIARPGQQYLLVGEYPMDGTVDQPQLWLLPKPGGVDGASRLVQFMGLSIDAYEMTFARTNLLNFVPPYEGGRRTFPLVHARAAAELILRYAVDHRLDLLILGKRGAAAFNWTTHKNNWKMPLARVGYLHWYSVCSAYDLRATRRAAIIPHTKGVNLWWNNRENMERAQRFFGQLEIHGA